MRWIKKSKKKVKKNLFESYSGAENVLLSKKGVNIGDTKEKIKFAFFPVKIRMGLRVWLESYVQVYTYSEVSYPIFRTYNSIYGEAIMFDGFEKCLEWEKTSRRTCFNSNRKCRNFY